MEKLLLFILFSGYVFGQVPAGYYDGTDGLSGYALKTKLHEIIATRDISYDYSDLGNGGLYQQTDRDYFYENDGSLLDIYSERPATADQYSYTFYDITGSASSEGIGWNREHVIPSSLFLPTGIDVLYPMYADLFSVIPADAYINQQRSNYPHATNNASSKTFSNGSTTGASTTPGYANVVYEPIDEFKGDIARIYLYFAVRYQSFMPDFDYSNARSTFDGSAEKAFKDWYINMLLTWHRNDPPSAREIDRNNKVFNLQKNRNPFIDHPQWVEAIWVQNKDNIAPASPAGFNPTQKGESFVTFSWTPSPESDVIGYKLYKDGLYAGQTNGTTFTFDRLNPGTTYTFEVKSYDNAFLESPTVAKTESTTGVDTLAKDLMITKYIEGLGANKALEITNKTGHTVNLANYQLLVEYAERSYDKNIYYRLEGNIAPGESVVIINPYASLNGYDISGADFPARGVTQFTGTQYIALTYNGNVAVDVVGFQGGGNSYGDMSLYRNTNVTDPTSTFNINEWTQYATNYSDGLGSGTLAADDVSLPQSQWAVYPNPVKEEIFVSGKEIQKISLAQIYDLTGKLILTVNQPFKTRNSISAGNLKPGMYLLKLDDKVLKFLKN